MGPGFESQALEHVFQLRPFPVPNRLVVDHADRLLECGGVLLNTLLLRLKIEPLVDREQDVKQSIYFCQDRNSRHVLDVAA